MAIALASISRIISSFRERDDLNQLSAAVQLEVRKQTDLPGNIALGLSGK